MRLILEDAAMGTVYDLKQQSLLISGNFREIFEQGKSSKYFSSKQKINICFKKKPPQN